MAAAAYAELIGCVLAWEGWLGMRFCLALWLFMVGLLLAAAAHAELTGCSWALFVVPLFLLAFPVFAQFHVSALITRFGFLPLLPCIL